MDIILEQYETRLRGVKASAPATLLVYSKAARKFQEHLDATGKRAADMEAWDLEDYLAGLDYALSTKNTHWIWIRAALREAHRRGMLPKDPTVDVFLAKPQKGVPETIPNAKLRAAKQRATLDRHWLAFHLLAYTGMRQSEIRGLRWGDVDPVECAIHLAMTKNGKPRYVPVHPALGDVLAELRQADTGAFVITTTGGKKPVAYDTWIRDLREFVPGYTAHWFRRTVTSSLLDNEADPRVVKQIMGWEDQAVMGRYYTKPSRRVMQREILKLYADDPI